MKKILVFGATSAIAIEFVKQIIEKDNDIMIAARSEDKLSAIAQDLKVRTGKDIATYAIDANDIQEHKRFFLNAVEKLKGLDTLLIAHGTLPDNDEIKNDYSEIEKEFFTNALSVISLTTIAAEYFEKQKNGTIAVISSVAGERSRQSNYIYGTAKGTVSMYLQGLRNRLYQSNVNVLTIKPGFVDTPMTAHLEKGFLFAKPDKVAKGIINAIQKKKDVVYLPWFWKYIMTIIKLIPEGLFKKLKL